MNEHGASGPLIHQGPSKGLNDPRWRGVRKVVATKAVWGCGPHVFLGEAIFKVVSGLVATGARWLGLLTKYLVG